MMDNLCLEIGHISINKHSETICGDFYYLLKDRDKTTPTPSRRVTTSTAPI